ncbi:MAG: TatD family hydrolase [Kiritimatiellae bacterium]|nr:TatD family hydrolase [Kiritimatiellia bacterium]
MSFMYFDTHVHLDEFEAEESTEAVIARAQEAGVNRMLAMGGNPEANRLAVELAGRYPGILYAAVGLDRDQASHSPDLADSASLAGSSGVRAIGEIGLDYHYHPETVAAQRKLFEAMLELARKCGLPVMIHSREAEEDTLALLRAYAQTLSDPSRAGALHCFTGSRRMAKALLDLGFYISFSGILTFPRAIELQEVSNYVPEDRLLIETDCPYLAPVPHRGKRNEPAYVIRVAEKLAELRGKTREEMARITTANACTLLNIE